MELQRLMTIQDIQLHHFGLLIKTIMMAGPYLNDSGYEVPDNKIIVVPQSLNDDGWYKEIIKPLKGENKRDWFNSHFYYCLPLSIGNQYGFVINSLRDFDLVWDGTDSDAEIIF